MNRLKKTALEWIVESGNADQLKFSERLGVEGKLEKEPMRSWSLCFYAELAQQVRARALQAWGHWFDSSTPHHVFAKTKVSN